MSYREPRLFKPHITRAGGEPTRYRFTLQCHQCPSRQSISGPSEIDDDAVAHKFKTKGWLIGRGRMYDLCPGCVGVPPESRLAAKFKVKRAGQVVKSPAEIAEEAEREHAATAARTQTILDRYFGEPGKPAKPSPADSAPTAPDQTTVALLLNDVSEIRAGIELLVEQASRRNDALEMANRLQHEHMDMWKQCMDMLDAQRRQQEQMLRAIANIVPTVVRSSEGISHRVREAVEGVAEIFLAKVPDTDNAAARAPQAIPGASCDDGEVMVRVADARAVVAAADSPGGLERLASTAHLISYPHGYKKRYWLTTIRVERLVWDEAGFTEGERFEVTAEDGWVIIRRAGERGFMPRNINRKSATFVTTKLGQRNYTRRYVHVGCGEIRL